MATLSLSCFKWSDSFIFTFFCFSSQQPSPPTLSPFILSIFSFFFYDLPRYHRLLIFPSFLHVMPNFFFFFEITYSLQTSPYISSVPPPPVLSSYLHHVSILVMKALLETFCVLCSSKEFPGRQTFTERQIVSVVGIGGCAPPQEFWNRGRGFKSFVLETYEMTSFDDGDR